ncbi:DUF3943 domain-containing protein, partial [Sulfuricurvum sp. RIFOXYD2_FULL_44_160]|uniref:DUF3943 domain-containing protein n=1 Tax=Sulfuricurvum sp. RIFOXYD2_FULL_44_160 TaxID=1802249 RepID=UPI002622A15C
MLCTYPHNQISYQRIKKVENPSVHGMHVWAVLFLSFTIPLFGDNTISSNAPKDYTPTFINVNEELPTRYKSVVEDSLYLQLIMLSSIGALAMMPEDITNWNAAKLEEKSLSQRWKDHVTTRPVWDNDSWAINYIGHPVSGAWYYTMGRNDGLSIGESAALSALMSTFV